MARGDGGEKVLVTNRKAFFRYEILERVEAGIALRGTEVKSIRAGGLNFSDSFVDFRGGELFLVGARIGPYSHGNIMNHLPERDRKLLLHKREILKLGGRVTGKGLTLVPLSLYFNERGRAKLQLALGRGRKLFDKREAIRSREAKRAIQRASRR